MTDPAAVGTVLVERCICMRVPFAELLPLARAGGWELEALMRETGCGTRCGLCGPYLRRMLRTGQTEFRELLAEHDG